MTQRTNHHLGTLFLSLVFALTGCGVADSSGGTRTLLRVADDTCAQPEEVCTASEPPTCYTVCADEAPPECIPEGTCSESDANCISTCAEEDGDECDGVVVTSAEGVPYFICGAAPEGDSGCIGGDDGVPAVEWDADAPRNCGSTEPGGSDGESTEPGAAEGDPGPGEFESEPGDSDPSPGTPDDGEQIPLPRPE
jgi:hypothetical protein